MIGAGKRRDDEHGGLAAAMLLFLVAVAGGLALFLQLGHATVLGTEARSAADAAALAGADSLRGQLIGHDLAFLVDRDEVCEAAADYAQRNGATLQDCDVDTTALTVTVAVRGDDGVIDGALEDAPDERATSRARAEVDLPMVDGVRGPGGGSGSLAVDRDALADEHADHTPEELLEELIIYAQYVHDLRLPYVWGGGHQSSPAPRDGPFDCSGAVSALLQTIYPDFPTITSGQFLNVGAPGPSPSGRGLTIYAYPGHVFAVVGGAGWGTGDPTWSGTDGAGWLSYDTPYHSLFQPRHIPLLEPDDPGAVEESLERHAPGASGGAGGGGSPVRAQADIRLVPID